ncbi:hypothetical protein, partial [Cryobacterium sp. TMT1-21]|uniref:hypothetical protein n=1 Tax=Cryobacterium sp. TMT1-21 TaxID=1259234 RepID=UPI001A7E0EE0
KYHRSLVMINRIRGKSPIKTPIQPKINATVVLGRITRRTPTTKRLRMQIASEIHIDHDRSVSNSVLTGGVTAMDEFPPMRSGVGTVAHTDPSVASVWPTL